MHTNLQNKTDPLIFIVQNTWTEQNQQILKWWNAKTQGSLKGKMLEDGTFAVTQLGFAPSALSDAFFSLDGAFRSLHWREVLPLVLSWCHWERAPVYLLSPPRLWLLSGSSALRLRISPLCFLLIGNWSCKIKGLLPKKPYLREGSRMLVM